MRKLYIIKAHQCSDGCRQYTRQDIGDFVDAEDIRVLREPPRLIERVYDRELEHDEFFYSHEDLVPSEANALLFDRRLERESSVIYAISYCHLQRVEEAVVRKEDLHKPRIGLLTLEEAAEIKKNL